MGGDGRDIADQVVRKATDKSSSAAVDEVFNQWSNLQSKQSQDDFTKAISPYLPQLSVAFLGRDSGNGKTFLQMMDANGDGKLEWKEIQNFENSSNDPRVKLFADFLIKHFSDFDGADGASDGKIDVSQLMKDEHGFKNSDDGSITKLLPDGRFETTYANGVKLLVRENDTQSGAAQAPTEYILPGPPQVGLTEQSDGSWSASINGSATDNHYTNVANTPDGVVATKDDGSKDIYKPDGSIVKQDSSGKALEIDYADGKNCKFSYDGWGNLNGYTDTSGQHWSRSEYLAWNHGRFFNDADPDHQIVDSISVDGNSVIMKNGDKVARITTGDPSETYIQRDDGTWSGEDGKVCFNPAQGKDDQGNTYLVRDNHVVIIAPDGKVSTQVATEVGTDASGNTYVVEDGKAVVIGANGKATTGDSIPDAIAKAQLTGSSDLLMKNADGSSSTYHLDNGKVTQITENPPGLVMKLDNTGAVSEVDFPGGASLVHQDDGFHLMDKNGDEGLVSANVSFDSLGKLTIDNNEVVHANGNFELIIGNKIQRFDNAGVLSETDYVTWSSEPHVLGSAVIGVKLTGPDELHPASVIVTDAKDEQHSFVKADGQWHQYDKDGNEITQPAVVGDPVVDPTTQSIKFNFNDQSSHSYDKSGADTYVKGNVAITATVNGDHIEKNQASGADVLYGSDEKMHGITWPKGALGDANPAWQQDRTTGEWKFIGPNGNPIDGPEGVVGNPVPHMDGSVTFDMGNGTAMTYDQYGHIKSMNYGKNEINFNISKDGMSGTVNPPGMEISMIMPGPPQMFIGKDGSQIKLSNDGVLSMLDIKTGITTIDLPNGDVKTVSADSSYTLNHPDGTHEFNTTDGIVIKYDSSNQVTSVSLLDNYVDVRKMVVDLTDPKSPLFKDLAGGGNEITLGTLNNVLNNPNASASEKAIAGYLKQNFPEFSKTNSNNNNDNPTFQTKQTDGITADTLAYYVGSIWDSNPNLADFNAIVAGGMHSLKDPFSQTDLSDPSSPQFMRAEAALLAKIDPALAKLIEDPNGKISLAAIDQALKNPQSLSPDEQATLQSLHDSFYLLADGRGVLDTKATFASLRDQGYAAVTDERMAQIATQIVHALIPGLQGTDSELYKDLKDLQSQNKPLTKENLQTILADPNLTGDEKAMVQSLLDSYGSILAAQTDAGMQGSATTGISLDFLAYESGYKGDGNSIAGAWDALSKVYSKPETKVSTNNDNSIVTTEFQAGKPVAIEIDYKGTDLPSDSKTIINYTVDGKTMTGMREPDGSILILQSTGVQDQYKVTRMVPVPGEAGKYQPDGGAEQLATVKVAADTGIISVDYGRGHTEVLNADGSRSVCAADGQPTLTYKLDAAGHELETGWKLGSREVTYKYDDKGSLTDAVISGQPPTYLHRADANSPWGVYADAGFKSQIGLLNNEDVTVGPKGPEITGKDVPTGKFDLFAQGRDFAGIPSDLGTLKPNGKGGWDLTKAADGSVVTFDGAGRVVEIKTQRPATTTNFNYTDNNTTPGTADVYDAAGKKTTVMIIEPVGSDGSYKASVSADGNIYEVVNTDGLHAVHDKSNPKTVEYEDSYGHVVKIDYNDGSNPPVVRKFDFAPANDPNGKLVDIVNPNGTIWRATPTGFMLYESNGKDPVYKPGTFVQETMTGSVSFDKTSPGAFTVGEAGQFPSVAFKADGSQLFKPDAATTITSDAFDHVTSVQTSDGKTRTFDWEPANTPDAQLKMVTEPSGEKWIQDSTHKDVYHHCAASGNPLSPADDARVSIDPDGTFRIIHLPDNRLEIEAATGGDSVYDPIKASDAPVVLISERPYQAQSNAAADAGYTAALYLSANPFTLRNYELREHGVRTDKLDVAKIEKEEQALEDKAKNGSLSKQEQDLLSALQQLDAFSKVSPNLTMTDFLTANLVKPGANAADKTHVLQPQDTPSSIAQQYVLSQHSDWAVTDPKTGKVSLDPKIYSDPKMLADYNAAVKAEVAAIFTLNHINARGTNLFVGQVLILDQSVSRDAAPSATPLQLSDKDFKPVAGETLTPGISQHLTNDATGQQVYKLQDGLVVSFDKSGQGVVYDKSGNKLGDFAATTDQIAQIASGKFDIPLTPASGSPVTRITESENGVTKIVCVDGSSEVDYSTGEKVHFNAKQNPDYIRLPNGSVFKMDPGGNGVIYDDGTGQLVHLATMPVPNAADGSFAFSEGNFKLSMSADGSLTLPNGDVIAEKHLANGFIEHDKTSAGKTIKTYDTPSGMSFVEQADGTFHIYAGGKDTGVLTDSAIGPSSDGGFEFKIQGSPDITFAVNADGSLSCKSASKQSMLLVAEALLKIEGKLPADYDPNTFNQYKYRELNKVIWDEYNRLLAKNNKPGQTRIGYVNPDQQIDLLSMEDAQAASMEAA